LDAKLLHNRSEAAGATLSLFRSTGKTREKLELFQISLSCLMAEDTSRLWSAPAERSGDGALFSGWEANVFLGVDVDKQKATLPLRSAGALQRTLDARTPASFIRGGGIKMPRLVPAHPRLLDPAAKLIPN